VSYGYGFERLESTEGSAEGTNPVKIESQIESITDRDESRTNIYMKASGGTARLEPNHTVTVWGLVA
jgi:hypothetical protein